MHELHRARAVQVSLGERREPLPGLDRRDVQAPSDEAARQLAAPAPELEHPIAAADAGELTCMVQQLLGVRGTVAVILVRHVHRTPCRGAVS